MWFQFSANCHSCETLSLMARVGPPFLVAQDLVDAIQDAEASKDWQAMRDAVAGWSLASISFYVIYVSIDPAIHTKLCLQVYVCSLLRENDGFYSVQSHAKYQMLRPKKYPRSSKDRGAPWDWAWGRIIMADQGRKHHAQQSSILSSANIDFCMIF